MNEHIALIQSLGLDVYLPDVPRARATWCYFTDGTRIGYAQWGGYDCSVSSVHVGNGRTGTGFRIANGISAESVRATLACVVPNWARRADADATHKYVDFAAFQRGHWCGLTKAEPQV